MRIPDEWQNNSIYLYPSEHDAYEGTRAGGSGFLLGFDSDRIPGRQMVYAVTNAHVIEGGNCTIRLNRHDGTVRYRRFAKAKNVAGKSPDEIRAADCEMCYKESLSDVDSAQIGQ